MCPFCLRPPLPTYDLIVEAYMPNLENLKKQAKLILRWHREGHYPVAAQIRRHLPRFLNMPDSSRFLRRALSSAMRRKRWRDSRASRVGKPCKPDFRPRRRTLNHRHPKQRLSVQSRNCSSPTSKDRANFSLRSYCSTASDRRKLGRSFAAAGGAFVGSGWLAGNCCDCSMDSSLSWTLDGGFQLREGKSSRYPTATRAQL